VQRLVAELERERDAGKQIATQATKMRGMLKTGQDALRAEQEVVAKLKKQLQQYIVSGLLAASCGVFRKDAFLLRAGVYCFSLTSSR